MSTNLEATGSTHSVILSSFDLVFLLLCNPPKPAFLLLERAPIGPFFRISHVAYELVSTSVFAKSIVSSEPTSLFDDSPNDFV